MLCQINNWTQLAGDGIRGGRGGVNTGSTRGDTVLSVRETRFAALYFGED
jgi:hypothetical protein